MNLPLARYANAESVLYVLNLLSLLTAFFCHSMGKAKALARTASIAAILFIVSSAAVRTLSSGRLPFASMYEFGLLLGIVLSALLLFVDIRYGSRAICLPASGAAFMLGSAMLLFFQEARPLMPALKSLWLGAHVLTAVLAYGFLALSAALALAGLLSPRPAAGLEALMNRLILAAFPLLTLLIITGAVWAEYAWGSFWRWDPKETWALITWILYIVYLHLVRTRGWKGRKAFVMAAACFAAVLFTFFGVNLLLAGLHGYV